LRVLLVEPDYRRNSRSTIEKAAAMSSASKRRNDESLWYPPLGLMKLSTFHKMRGDEVHFAYGCIPEIDSFELGDSWDRIYITTLFTFRWGKTVETINYYKNLVWGDTSKIFVGGIMASLLPDKVYEATGIYPVKGVIRSPEQIGLPGTENIDLLAPDYDILDNRLYAINDTYYAYTTRGCVNKCPWCGVPILEPGGVYYIDIKDIIRSMRRKHGDKPKLKLMDNNVLASPDLEKIIEDLVELGYGRNMVTNTDSPRERVIDFNQGLDASFLTEENMKLLAKLNIKPVRIAFDRIGEKDEYLRALKLAKKYGARVFSNYMLYNYQDTPKDLYERLIVNINLNKRWRSKRGRPTASIYSYPMRYAPIDSTDSPTAISQENGICVPTKPLADQDGTYNGIFWTKRFIRNVEIMKGVAYGSVSPTPSLARRTLGKTFREFVANLYMPEELLRYRNKYEQEVCKFEPKRDPGTGEIESFRVFISKLLETKGRRFTAFHYVVSKNRKQAIRGFLASCEDEEMKKWLRYYLL